MPATPQASSRQVISDTFVLGLLFSYFAAHTFLRVLASGNVQLDESQQLILAQELHWGYGSQPPLYTWLQNAVFQVLDVNVLALALLKNFVLSGTYWFTYRSVKKLTGSPADALAAMSALLLLPQIAWESQRDQSNSVVATMAAAAALYWFISLSLDRRSSSYFLLGLFAAMGCLGKYNYAVFLASLLLAAASLSEFRPVLRDRRIWLSLGVFALVLLPHAVWMWQNPTILLQEADKLHVPESVCWWKAYASGLSSLVATSLAFSGLAVLTFVFLYFRPGLATAESPALASGRKLTGRTLLLALVICVALVFLGRARFRDRWLQSLLFATPIYLVLVTRSHLPATGWRRLWWLNGCVAVGMLVAQPLAIYLEKSATNENKRMSQPFAALADQLRQRGFTRGVICTAESVLGGNLKLRFPDSRVITPENEWFAAPANVPWLGVYEISLDGDGYPVVTNLIGKLRGDDLHGVPPQQLEAVGRQGRSQPTKLGFILLPPKN